MSAETDAWAELQALKSRRDSRRRKLEERKKERQEILIGGTAPGGIPTIPTLLRISTTPRPEVPSAAAPPKTDNVEADTQSDLGPVPDPETREQEGEVEEAVLQCLCELALTLPIDSRQLLTNVNKILDQCIQHSQILNYLQKFTVQELICIQEKASDLGGTVDIISAEHPKILAMVASFPNPRKRKAEDDITKEEDGEAEGAAVVDEKKPDANDVLSLLSMASTRERESKRVSEDILELLVRPSAREKTIAAQFRSQGRTSVREYCPHGTKSDCRRVSSDGRPCPRVHFRKIIQNHTDETLGDCSFLNTCFHMESCKYVHYDVDSGDRQGLSTSKSSSTPTSSPSKRSRIEGGGAGGASDKPPGEVPKGNMVMYPGQWLHCDLRFFDMTVLGKFSVIMADPPWDIHMELPYGTLSDDEMRQLNIPALQDEGLIFLWVTGRAMELGRECLQLWGYERVDELIWVKTNQLQRIIRTGRTGHWLNHGKEHCLVGMKGNPHINTGLDADIIVSEVRATSHKPDEVYGIIERLSPGTRKIELFGRPHNIQNNWVTLGNQLEGAHLVDEELSERFYARYPDGNCMVKPK